MTGWGPKRDEPEPVPTATEVTVAFVWAQLCVVGRKIKATGPYQKFMASKPVLVMMKLADDCERRGFSHPEEEDDDDEEEDGEGSSVGSRPHSASSNRPHSAAFVR